MIICYRFILYPYSITIGIATIIGRFHHAGGSSAPSVSSGSMAHIARAAADAPAPWVGRDMRLNDANTKTKG